MTRTHPTPPVNVPPPGWTPEADRREEFADLNWITVLHKAGRQEHG